jgi:hypothetical protein
MKTTVRRARAAGSRPGYPREFDIRSLPSGMRTMQFTLAEVRQIEKAATKIGLAGEGASFGRNIVLHVAAEILRSGS